MQVVTCANKSPTAPYYLFDEFKTSLAKYGIEPIILGWGEHWGGLGSKPRMLKKAIESGRITSEDMIFCDAFDVVFLGDPHDIPSHSTLLYNAEKNCFPDGTLADKHPDTPYPYKYLNSGLSIGKTQSYLDMLIEMKADEIPDDHQVNGQWVNPNDQDNVMRQFLFGSVPMKLDSGCGYFQTMIMVEEGELTFEDKITNQVTGSSPIVFHFNGPSKEGCYRDRVLARLG